MRGFAALAVLMYHALLAMGPIPAFVKYSPLRLLCAGESAVMLFFVLSGFVLHLTFVRNDHRSLVSFYIKRFARIYPPFAVAILLSALLFLLTPHPVYPGMSEWMTLHWQDFPTWPVILGHLAMTDNARLQSLDDPMWTLVVELRISLLFPLISAGVTKNWKATAIIAVILSFASQLFLLRTHYVVLFNIPNTLQYAYLFAAGAILCELRTKVQTLVSRLRPWFRASLWLVTLSVFSIEPTKSLGILTALSALLLVALILGDVKISRLLETKVPLWLGKISYSLYLIHVPLMVTFVYGLNGYLPLPFRLILAGVAALTAAEAMQRVIERPSAMIGRLAANALCHAG